MGIPDLERYSVKGELGQGGMSIVYRARDEQLSRDVALKVLHDFLAKQADARRRFHREAVAVAKLHHPGILEIFDYSGPDAKQAYIVTELIEGKTLREFVETVGFPKLPELGALMVAELARALRHAHEQGVIHRDLKPENIMITESGQLKLMDFGIAQIMGGATKLTATGTLLGSPAHMAPEVIDGVPSDHRCDIFSLGTILYLLTVGQLPFEAPNPSALFRKILDGSYEHPQMLEPKIGNGLARIIDQSLAPDLEQRYQDVSELQEDLLCELEETGLMPLESVVKQYLLAPQAYQDDLEPKLVERLAASGKQALSDGNIARATDRFNRVLAIDPEHKEVLAITTTLGRKASMIKKTKQTALALSMVGLLGGVGYGGTSLLAALTPPPKKTPEKTLEGAQAALGVVQPSENVSLPKPEIETPDAGGPSAEVRPKKTTPRKRPRRRPPKAPPPPAKAPPVKVPLEVPPEVQKPEAPKPVEVRLMVRCGGSFGSIYLGEKRLYQDALFGKLELRPGRHEVWIKKQFGPGSAARSRRKQIEVTEKGAIFEVRPNGRRPLKQGDSLAFEVPKSASAIKADPQTFEGWTW